jgi:ribosome-associated protein
MVNIDFLKLAVKAAKIADDKKAIDTIVLDVQDLTTMTNYFVVSTAESTPQINAISSDIEKTFKYEDSVIPARREGISSSTWRIIDYGGLVIHIMSADVRSSYNLESLWHKAKIINVNGKEKMSIPTIKKTSVAKNTPIKKVIKKPAKEITKTKLAEEIVKKTSRKISKKKKQF